MGEVCEDVGRGFGYIAFFFVIMIKDCIVCVCNVEFMIVFKTLVFCFRLARDVASSLPCCLILFVLFLALWG